jgi:hypothetical protein
MKDVIPYVMNWVDEFKNPIQVFVLVEFIIFPTGYYIYFHKELWDSLNTLLFHSDNIYHN